MTTRGFQCKFAVASGQDREPISLEQFPDEILFMHIVFNKQNYHRVHINLFNGLRASKEIFCDIAATSLKIRDLNFADCIVAPGLRGAIGVSLWRVPVTGKRTLKGFCGTLVWFVPYLNWRSRRTIWRHGVRPDVNQSRRRVVSPCARAVMRSRSRMAVNMDRTCGIARFSLPAIGR